MNEELSENVVLGDNAEEKNREVYTRPRLKKLEINSTQHYVITNYDGTQPS